MVMMISFSELLDVPLTTVHQPVYDMGVEAVRQLAAEVESERGSRKMYYISTGAYRKGKCCG